MRALVAAALFSLGVPAAAGATDYGGGTAPDSVRRANGQLTLIGFRMADDGTGQAIVKVAAGCGVAKATRDIGLAADGTFTLETTERDRVGGGVRQSSEITLSGQIVGAVASGTVNARVIFRRKGRVVERCDSGTREWNARLAGATGAGSPPGGYYGLTSQTGRPFPLVLTLAGSRVRVAAFDYRMRCRRGGFEWENITPGGRLAADGSFSLRERFSRRWREGRERFRVKVDGQFTPGGVSGTVSVTSILRTPGGRVLDRCTTGRRTFAAIP
jgi:hypothetical protein